MARMSLPPGFRFHPTDVELIMYYLKTKTLGKKLRFEVIAEVNVYKYSPCDLPGCLHFLELTCLFLDKSCLKSRDLEWFFFCPVSRKYSNGTRLNRATETGYWKSTGKDRTVMHNGRTVGMVKTLVFHQGPAPKGNRTDWVLHEYRILENELADAGVGQAAYVLLKLFKKSGPGPKNGAQYGAPFNEEEWDADDADENEICAETPQHSKIFPFPAVANNIGSVKSTFLHGNASAASLLPPVNLPFSAVTHNNCHSVGTSSFFEDRIPTVSFLPPESRSLSAAAHDNSNSVIMDLLPPVNSPLPAVTHNNCHSVGTSSAFEGTSVLPSESRPLLAVAHDNNFVITGKLVQDVPPTGPLPGPGPSTAMSLANDVAPPVGEEVDLESLLAMLTEDPPMSSDANDFGQVNGEFMELDDIYGGLVQLTDAEEFWHWDQSCLSDNVDHC